MYHNRNFGIYQFIRWVYLFSKVSKWNFQISALLLRNQSICNLVTIVSLYCSLQCTYFLSRMLNNYIDLTVSYLLREWYLLSHRKAVVFCAFMHVSLKNNIQVEFEYLHSFNLFCMNSLNINIEYVNGIIFRKS